MSFDYTGLQGTAVRIIERFGRQMVWQFNRGQIDPVTQKRAPNWGQAVTRGVRSDSEVSLVDGSRIEQGRKVYLLDPTVTPEMGWRYQSWTVVEIKELKPADVVMLYEVQVVSGAVEGSLVSAGQGLLK